MAQILSYFPGQTATVFLETKNSDGYYMDGSYSDGYAIDGYESPVIQRIIYPDFTLDGYYPQPMTQLSTGLYCFKFILPFGATSVGSYFVDIAYREPNTYSVKFQSYQVIVNAPFGLYSATSF